jgi:polyhydroxyalkanoate synthesis regulator phasin
VRWTESARAADVSQAAYFRATLADEREPATNELAQARERLRALTEGNEVLGFRGMARARSRVRELEHQVRELDRLIAALDRRFAARWSADR